MWLTVNDIQPECFSAVQIYANGVHVLMRHTERMVGIVSLVQYKCMEILYMHCIIVKHLHAIDTFESSVFQTHYHTH